VVDLGGIPSGSHRYRIAWTKAITSDQVQFFIDDTLVAELTDALFPPLYVYLWRVSSGSRSAAARRPACPTAPTTTTSAT
jgi:hypothetical protein